MNETQRIASLINANLLTSGAKPLPEYIQGNNFSGLVSSILCDAIDGNSPYQHNSDQGPKPTTPLWLARRSSEMGRFTSTRRL